MNIQEKQVANSNDIITVIPENITELSFKEGIKKIIVLEGDIRIWYGNKVSVTNEDILNNGEPMAAGSIQTYDRYIISTIKISTPTSTNARLHIVT